MVAMSAVSLCVLSAALGCVSGDRISHELSLIQAKATAFAGATYENKPAKKAIAVGNKSKTDESVVNGPENTKWNVFKDTYSGGYADSLSTRYSRLDEAQQQCLEMGADYCQAVTCKKGGQCTVRKTYSLKYSTSGETTYILDGHRAPRSACDLKGGCSIFNDKNVVVFDGQRVSLLEGPVVSKDDEMNLVNFLHESQGEVWLVKSKKISIQARYTAENAKANKRLSVRSVAVGGDFLNGSKLIIGPLADKITWDGTEILSEDGSDFHVDGFISAKRHNHSCSVQRLASEGKLANETKLQAGIDITLPKAVKLTVNRQKDYVNVHINMPAPWDGQEGLCGNNNGNPNDDSLKHIIEKKPAIIVQESILPPKGILNAMYSYLR